MRAMRLQKRAVTEYEDLKEILEACQVVRIGAVDEEGLFIVPVNFGYEFYKDSQEEIHLKLYIHSAKEGRKAEAFAQNPNVTVEMDCAQGVLRGVYTCDYSFAYSSIMGNGVIRLVTEEAEQIYGLKLLMNHMVPKAELEFLPQMLEKVYVYCIELKDFSGKRRKEI